MYAAVRLSLFHSVSTDYLLWIIWMKFKEKRPAHAQEKKKQTNVFRNSAIRMQLDSALSAVGSFMYYICFFFYVLCFMLFLFTWHNAPKIGLYKSYRQTECEFVQHNTQSNEQKHREREWEKNQQKEIKTKYKKLRETNRNTQLTNRSSQWDGHNANFG